MSQSSNILEIKNINISINKKQILKNFSLSIKTNETHIIMGPNGSGKSTLSKILTGYPFYHIDSGSIKYCNENLSKLEPEIRSKKGLFLGFQYPIEITDVTNFDFLQLAYNETQKYLNNLPLNTFQFLNLILPLISELKIKKEFLYRNVNEGFSGGEKKKNEILQMLLLKPILVILDEIDSGLDIDSTKLIWTKIFNKILSKSSYLIITHTIQLLNQIKFDYLHIMKEGEIIKNFYLKKKKKVEIFNLISLLKNKGYSLF
jgi:Fe-S cluster assembly ATP-binding protein